MALLVSSSLPTICPWTLAVGAGYTHATHFIVGRPALGALYHKARAATTPADVLKSEEAATAAVRGSSSVLVSLLQTYGTASLLKLAGSTNYKGASIIGTLLFAATAAPQLVSSILLQKKTLDVVLSEVAVQLLDTVGLALMIQWYRNRAGPTPIPKFN